MDWRVVRRRSGEAGVRETEAAAAEEEEAETAEAAVERELEE